MAFVASSLGKEGALGVLSTIYTGSGTISVGSVVGGAAAENINELLVTNVSKPEALALIFAMTFNMPCIVALAATYQETHSVKWTARIALYYTGVALILAGIAYHVGLVIWYQKACRIMDICLFATEGFLWELCSMMLTLQ